MSKDSTQALTAGPNTRLWLAPTGTAEPATAATAFSGSWIDMGYLSDPPSIARDKSTTDMDAWNASDPLRTLTDTDVSTVELKLMQTNRATLALYFGPLVYTLEPGGASVSIEPDTAASDAQYVMCLELVDGANVLRIYWRVCSVDTTGDLSMDKAAAITYDATLKRLAPPSGTKSYRIQTNVAGLVSA